MITDMEDQLPRFQPTGLMKSRGIRSPTIHECTQEEELPIFPLIRYTSSVTFTQNSMPLLSPSHALSLSDVRERLEPRLNPKERLRLQHLAVMNGESDDEYVTEIVHLERKYIRGTLNM